jgi:hypothetical protein
VRPFLLTVLACLPASLAFAQAPATAALSSFDGGASEGEASACTCGAFEDAPSTSGLTASEYTVGLSLASGLSLPEGDGGFSAADAPETRHAPPSPRPVGWCFSVGDARCFPVDAPPGSAIDLDSLSGALPAPRSPIASPAPDGEGTRRSEGVVPPTAHGDRLDRPPRP